MNKQSKQLGAKLKEYRELANKQVEDTAEAIELEALKLTQIESGEEALDEEILAMLISHFKLKEEQAVELWEMAGYETIDYEREEMDEPENKDGKKEIRINIPADTKVLYCDMAQVSTNQYGLVINFMQSAPGNNAMVTSRIGMSKEHAKKFINMLQNNLEDQD